MAAGGLRLCHVTGSCDWRLRGSLTRQAPKSHDRHLHHQPSSSLPDLPTVTATNNRLLDDQGILFLVAAPVAVPLECLVPLKVDFYQLMAVVGWDGGPLAMDVGACPPP